MAKTIFTFVIIISGVLAQAQNSVTLKSYQKVGWIGSECVGSDNSEQSIIFNSNSIVIENVKAKIKSKSAWENIEGDWLITFYDYNSDPIELYISGSDFQFTVISGNVRADYTGYINQNQIKNLKTLY